MKLKHTNRELKNLILFNKDLLNYGYVHQNRIFFEENIFCSFRDEYCNFMDVYTYFEYSIRNLLLNKYNLEYKLKDYEFIYHQYMECKNILIFNETLLDYIFSFLRKSQQNELDISFLIDDRNKFVIKNLKKIGLIPR